MAGVFISYRREDSGPYAGRLYDRLQAHFGKEQVFMDIDTLKPGEDFVEVLENTVASCDVLVAVIGRKWLTVKIRSGSGDWTIRRTSSV
jgi:TIR domain